jgi:hypothetical protein
MATSDQNHPSPSDQDHQAPAREVESQTQGDEHLVNEQHTPLRDGSVHAGADALHLANDTLAGESIAPVTEYHLADNDLVVAIAATSPDTLASIEHTLDQLTTATDLFDVSAVDFDTGSGS